MVKGNEFHKIIDIDNIFRQKIKQVSAIHTIRVEIKDDYIVRNFYKTLMNVDNIFKRDAGEVYCCYPRKLSLRSDPDKE